MRIPLAWGVPAVPPGVTRFWIVQGVRSGFTASAWTTEPEAERDCSAVNRTSMACQRHHVVMMTTGAAR